MASWRRLLAQLLCSALIACGIPGFMCSAAAQQAAAQEAATAATNEGIRSAARQPLLVATTDASASPALNELPDSPGATLAKRSAQEQIQQQNNSASVSEAPSSAPQQSAQPEQPAQQPPPQNPQPSTQQPVGTAAAEASHATGVAASQPAGVAIAPAKQHRARTIVIRVGAILGAGAALGSVVALTEATPSKPPGAH